MCSPKHDNVLPQRSVFTSECCCVYFFHCATKYHKLSNFKQRAHLPLLQVRSLGVVQLESAESFTRPSSVFTGTLIPAEARDPLPGPRGHWEDSVTWSCRSEVAASLQVPVAVPSRKSLPRHLCPVAFCIKWLLPPPKRRQENLAQTSEFFDFFSSVQMRG